MSRAAALATVAVLVVLDRVTKLWILSSMSVGETFPVIDGLFSITSVRNRGAAFGMFSSLPDAYRLALFVVVGVGATLGIGYLMLRRDSDPAERLPFAGILGGALGNFYDRLAYGEVVDFLDVYVGEWHWPAFNVADSGITIGAVLLVLMSLRGQSPGQSP